MTTPYERKLALERTREFLMQLLDRDEMPRLPPQVRARAASLLKHYPTGADLSRLVDACPDVLAGTQFMNR